MRCDRFREAVSARLDGEPTGMSDAVLDAHLGSCLDCAGWREQATRLTRQARLAAVNVPDLAESITAGIALPARRVLRRRLLLRQALALVGVVQLLIAAPALDGDSLGMAMSAHAAHEAAAWNLAIAFAFLASALRPRRAAGLVPLLGTFIVVLAVLSVRDLAAGAVSLDRIATHAAALIGLALLLALDRAERALPPGRTTSTDERRRPGAGDGGLRGVA
ncbi:MAG: zf-HC2 domain-containing protein [Jatrophihabitantaceae bacterium]